ncbi:MAG: peptidoglycan editing factor PgeF [Candidatus Omnitrophica bacterium]|nr:peptidoglycan editing factor PgeF [Candidatus Omnitrophota bacterium]MCM8817292.1 peptidoglycan editing factor PgeF [Candidatus Omnitrophota bacterium]
MNWSNYPFYIVFDEMPVFTFFTTRHCGVSLWPFESFNVGFNTPDKPASVIQNRLLVASKTNIPIESFVFLKQVHKDCILYVDKNQCKNALQEPALEGDGMFTDKKGICLGITLADCVGVVIYDRKQHIAGICHSGWKGCMLNICGKLVDKMVERCGCLASNLIVSISPSICYNCYTVSEEIVARFSEHYMNFTRKRFNRYHLDLRGIVLYQLISKGIKKENIFNPDICTFENTHIFYSHRAEKNTGRFMFGVYLR